MARTKKQDTVGGIAPLFALNEIVYGEQQRAAPNSIFVPVSEDERNELLAMEAARELDEAEAALAAAMGLDAPAAAPSDEAPTTGDADDDVIE